MFATPASDTVVSYSRCGDSAIWTGHWLAAESFRYAVTQSPEALTAVKQALEGINLLLSVSGKDRLARCAVPVDSPYLADITSEERHNGAYQGTFRDRSFVWVGHTSRDQYAGVVFGLGVAYDWVEDQEVRGSVRNLTTRLLDRLLDDNWMVRDGDGSIATTFLGRSDQQLAFLQVGRRVHPERFSSKYRWSAYLTSFSVLPPVALEVLNPHEHYFKFNLDSINFFHLIRLEGNGYLRGQYRSAYNTLRKTVDDHGNAHFDMLDRVLNGPEEGRDARVRRMLDEWLQRPRRDDWVDLRGQRQACGEDQACAPIPVAQRVRTDFLWQRSPFLLYGGGEGRIEGAGIDYILPYWLARAYGVVQE